MKKRFRQIAVLMLAAALLGTTTGSAGASAASGSISEVKQKKSELESDLKNAQALIDQLKTQEGDIESAVRELDEKLTSISEKMDDLEQQTEQKNQELQDTQVQLSDAQANESDQYESMKVRIRYMYQNSGMNYLEALLESGSFAEMLKQIDYMHTMLEYDREKLQEYRDTQNLIENAEEVIKKDKSDLEALQAQLEEEQQAVNLLMTEKQQQLSGVRDGISEAQETAEQYEKTIAAENQLIQDMLEAEAAAKKAEEERQKQEELQRQQEEEKRQEEEKKNQSSDSSEKENTDSDKNTSGNNTSGSSSGSNNSSSSGSNVKQDDSYTGGVFTWPCPSSHRITSGFGYRNSPTAGASSYHQGYDIGASAGAAIVAAADGVVTSTGYSSVLGNYVILSHGGGLFTIYEHCSSVLVSKGQSVSRGATIAKVGSTGIATGPHLHFGVQLNGSYVDPGKYL